MHALTSEVQRQAAGLRVVFANGGARLHIVGDHARVHHSDANRVRCAGERLIRRLLVADMSVVRDIARRLGEDKRRLRPQRLFHVSHDGKLFPCDADQFGAVARLIARIGDHHRDDVADMVRFVRRHHWIRLERRVRPVGIRHGRETGQVADVSEIARDIHGPNARGGARRLDIVDAEFRMSVRTA